MASQLLSRGIHRLPNHQLKGANGPLKKIEMVKTQRALKENPVWRSGSVENHNDVTGLLEELTDKKKKVIKLLKKIIEEDFFVLFKSQSIVETFKIGSSTKYPPRSQEHLLTLEDVNIFPYAHPHCAINQPQVQLVRKGQKISFKERAVPQRMLRIQPIQG